MLSLPASAGEQSCDISEKFCKLSLLPPEQFFSWEGCLVVDLPLSLPSSFPQPPAIKKHILFHFQMASLFSKTNNPQIKTNYCILSPTGCDNRLYFCNMVCGYQVTEMKDLLSVFFVTECMLVLKFFKVHI